MQYRIRASALIVNDSKVLLVKHVHPIAGYEWWVPPGGGVEPRDSSIFDCAQRETFEETGLNVKLSRIAYVREFVDGETNTHNLELYLLGESTSGELTLDNIHGNGPDQDFIKDVRWLTQEELLQIVVFPEILRDTFWYDFSRGFPEVRYLGVQRAGQ
jgi:8-oxo-dGTP pyrophosphatase MutT (NUDIX family)